MWGKIKAIIFNKEMFWTFLFQIGTLLGGILLIKLLAYLLTKEEYGYYALITSVSSLILMLPYTALLQGINRYVSIYQKKGRYKEFSSNIFTLFVVITTTYIILTIFVKNIFSLEPIWDQNIVWIIAFIVSEIFKTFFRTVNNANRERKNIGIAVFLEFATKLGVLYLCYKTSTISLSFVLIALFIGNTLAAILMYYKNKLFISSAEVNIRSFKVYTLRIWKYSYPLLIWALFGWFRDMSNRWYLDFFMEKEQVALFAMMSSLALVAPTALQGVIGNFFVPILYQKENENKGATQLFLQYALPILTLIFLIAFSIVYFFKAFIVELLTDAKYLSAAWMLPWLFLTYSVYIISMISTYEIFAKNQTKKLIISSVTPGVISLIGGYFLIKNFGINGAMYNYIITYNTYSILTFYVVYKFWKRDDREN